MKTQNIPLIDELNNQTGGEFNFMLKFASLDENANFCVLEIFYRDGILLSLEKKHELESLILKIVPNNFKYEIRFIKNFISEQRVSEEFNNFLTKSFPAIAFKLVSVSRNENCFTINFLVDSLSFDYAIKKKLSTLVSNHLKNLFDDNEFECNFSEENLVKDDPDLKLKLNYKEQETNIMQVRKIEFSDEVLIVGNAIGEPASYIKDKTSPEENVVLCGKIKFIKSHVLKPRAKKKKDDDALDETSENSTTMEEKEEDAQPKYERKLYKWELEDFTGKISCVFFSNKENQSKLEKLESGSVICVRGKVEQDKFSDGINLIVHDIAYCTLPEKFEEVIVYHLEKPFYEFVNPEPVVVYAQDNLLNFSKEKHTPKFLQGKTFVCYDFETTGLHFENGDKIIEIGAVKIVDGHITERFMSYVNPEMPIPSASTAVSGIVDDDVKDAPIDAQILGDFFKFTRGSILIGYNNINFDNVFLIGQGKKCRWNFNQETDDVYRLAQKYVHGVRNYKLSTVAEKLGVVLDNAHRAVYDAQATAEVFIKIAELMEKE